MKQSSTHRVRFIFDRPFIFLLLMLSAPSFVLYGFDLSEIPRQIAIKNNYYTISSARPSSHPGSLQFEVTSSQGVYQIEGFMPLEKLTREIEVIDRVLNQGGGTGFVEGATDSVQATAVGLGNLVIHPVHSVKGIGKAAGKLGNAVGGMFRKKEEGEKTSFGESVLGANRREVAKKIGADVYTRNPKLRALIENMANSRLGGQGAVMVIQFLLPIAALASVAMTAGSINGRADQIVNDTSRPELFKMNVDALKALGITETAAKSFLDKPFLTPREQTYFRFYLEALNKVEGFGTVFEAMLNAQSEFEALKRLYEAQIAAGEKKIQPVKVWTYPEGLAILDLRGKIIFITAYDQLDRDSLGQQVLDRINAVRAINRMPAELLNGGFVTGAFRQAAKRQDVSVRDWCFFEKEDRS